MLGTEVSGRRLTQPSFLTGRGVVEPARVELELCLLSVAYLNFPDICAPSRKEALLLGHYSFYEYAVASWAHHLVAWLSEKQHEEVAMAELEETLGPFLDQHSVLGCPPSNISSQMHEKLKAVRHFDFYDSLTQALVWSRKQFLVVDNLTNENQPAHRLDFPSITKRVRSLLEDTIRAGLTSEARGGLELYYGKKWFRCPRIYCPHFYDGFEAQDDRDKHVNRHERAYMCTFDGCHMATIGCVWKKDLDKHLMESHGIGTNGVDFPNVSNPNETLVRKVPATFRCTLCPKIFTRAHNLRSHFRAHTDERPFVCTVCGKAFSRNHDRKMHERLHSGEKKFVCKGDLKGGGGWGCGRRFTMAKSLARHFRSEAGRICIEPLLDEEMMEPQRLLEEEHLARVMAVNAMAVNQDSRQAGPVVAFQTLEAPFGMPSPSGQLPAALLAQFPALAQFDGNQMMDEGEDGDLGTLAE